MTAKNDLHASQCIGNKTQIFPLLSVRINELVLFDYVVLW